MNKKKSIQLILESNGKRLTLGSGTKYGIATLEGLESSEITLNLQTNAQYDGSSFTGSRVESRVISVEAGYPADDTTEDTRHWLQNFFVVHHPGTLTVDYCGTKRSIPYYVSSFKDNRANLHEPLAFLFELTCPDPYFSGEAYSENIAAKVPMMCAPFTLWQNAPGFTVTYRTFRDEIPVTNSGAVPTGLEIEFVASGTVKNPRLDNLTTGEFLRVLVDMKGGDHLLVTTKQGNKRIELNGVNISHKKDRQSVFFQIAEGENRLKYSADEGYANLDVFPRWSAQYLGV